jgi:hypothetical protein
MHPTPQPKPTGPWTQPNGPGAPPQPQPGPPQFPSQFPPSPSSPPHPQCPWPWPSCCHGIPGALGKDGAALTTADPSPRLANPRVPAMVTAAAIALRFIMQPLYATSRFATFAPNDSSDPELLAGMDESASGSKSRRCHAPIATVEMLLSKPPAVVKPSYLASVKGTSCGLSGFPPPRWPMRATPRNMAGYQLCRLRIHQHHNGFR